MATATVTVVTTVTTMASATWTWTGGRPRLPPRAAITIFGPFLFATCLSCIGFGVVLVQTLQYFWPTTHHCHVASCRYSPAHRLHAIDADQLEVPWNGRDKSARGSRAHLGQGEGATRDRNVEAGTVPMPEAVHKGTTPLPTPEGAPFLPASPLAPQHDAYPHSAPSGLRYPPSITSLVDGDPFRRGSAATLLLDFPPAHAATSCRPDVGPDLPPKQQVSCPIRRRLQRWDKRGNEDWGEAEPCKGYASFRAFKWMPVLVAFITIVNTLLTCFDISRSVKMFIYSAGSPRFFAERHFENGTAALLGLIPAAATQIFLLRRCLLFMRHLAVWSPRLGHRLVRTAFAVLASVAIGIAVVSGALGQAMVLGTGSQAAVRQNTPNGPRFQRLELACFISSAFVDLLLSATLCTELHWAKIGNVDTNDLLSRLVYVTFQGGVLAASMQVTLCVLLLGEPQGAWINVLWYLLPKVYFSTLLMSIIKTCNCPQGISTVGTAAAPVDITRRRDSAIDMQDIGGKTRACMQNRNNTRGDGQTGQSPRGTSFKETLRHRASRIQKPSGRLSPFRSARRSVSTRKERPAPLRTDGHATTGGAQLQPDIGGPAQSLSMSLAGYTFPPTAAPP